MRVIIVLVFCLQLISSQAQLIQPGFEFGFNGTNVYSPKTNKLMGGYLDRKPFLGGFAGGFIRINYDNKMFFKSSLVYESRNILSDGGVLTDPNGNKITNL